jgi:plasmid stabilization system protein ParE
VRKKFRVEITASAERDVLAIRDFIGRDKPRAGDKWARLIVRQIRSLKSMPQRHEVIPEAIDLGVEYRHVISGNYRTLYRIENDRVIVLRVIHASRLLDQSLLSG